MTQIIPFESSALPAHIAQMFPVEKLGVEGIGGFPIISIKGKVFTIVRGDEREVVLRPGEGDPAGSIDVVILKQNPTRSKVFYPGGYSEGSDEKPACFSNDGVAPDPEAAAPQANKCAVCPHNQWGSRITDNGKKGKACSDSQRIAVAPLGLINDPMLIRVPAASLKALDTYGQSLVKRGVPYQAVVTKIGFDFTVAHPSLTFKGIGFIDDASLKQVFEVSQEPIIEQIIGTKPSHQNDFEQTAQVAAPATAAPPTMVSQVPVQQAPVMAAPVQQVVQQPVYQQPVQQVVQQPAGQGYVAPNSGAVASGAFAAPAPATSAFAAPVQQPVQQVVQQPVQQPVYQQPVQQVVQQPVVEAQVVQQVQQAPSVVQVVESSGLAGEIGALLDTLNFDDPTVG